MEGLEALSAWQSEIGGEKNLTLDLKQTSLEDIFFLENDGVESQENVFERNTDLENAWK